MQNLLLLNTILLSLGGININPPTQKLTANIDYYNIQSAFVGSTFTTEGGPGGLQYFYNFFFEFPAITNPILVFRLPYEMNDRINDGTAYDHKLRMDYYPYTTFFHYQKLQSYTMYYKYYSLVPLYDTNNVVSPPVTYKNSFYYEGTASLKIPTNHIVADPSILNLLETDIVFGTYDWYLVDNQSFSYDNGYDAGYSNGHGVGYDDGYYIGFDDGNDYGYDLGYDQGVYVASLGELPDLFTILGSAFTSIASILSISLFPGFTLGLLLFLPLIFGIAYVLLKLLLGNG